MNELIPAFVGALFGAVAAAALYTREARRQLRIDSLRRFVANRFHLTGPEFSQSLNEAVVVYADVPAVVKALDAFRATRTNDNLLALYRAMSKAAGIPHKDVSDDLFLTPFNVAPASPPP